MADISAALKIFGGFMETTEALTKPIDQMQKLDKIAGNVAVQFQKAISAIESYVQLDAKLGLMTKSLEEHAKLQDSIFESAKKSRNSYSDMVDIVTKLGLSTGNLFNSNQEVVDFSELMQKSIVASGTSDDKKPVVIQQMASTLAGGGIDSSGLISIAQTAPVIYEAIAGYTGKSGEELLSMADKGELTAELIKNSMFGMQSMIEDRFSQMPLTFSNIMDGVKNAGTDAFGNLFTSINNLLTSQGFVDFFNNVIKVIYLLGDAIDYVINLLTENWPVIESILMAIGVLLAVKIISLLPVIIGQLMTMLPILLSNLALFLLNNGAIILVVAAIASVIYLLRTMGEETMAAIGQVFGFVIALFVNLFLALTQLVFARIEYWINKYIAFANFLVNVFRDPIGAIIHLFFDLADRALGALEKIAAAIDFVFGKNLADTVKGWRADLQVLADEKAKEYGNGKYEKKIPKLDINNILGNLGISMNRLDYTDTMEAGESIGGDIGKSIEKFLGGGDSSTNVQDNPASNSKGTNPLDLKGLESWFNNLFPSDNSKGKDGDAGNNAGYDTSALGNYSAGGLDLGNNFNTTDLITGANPLPVEGTGPDGSVNVEMPDDDLEYLREIAERDYIANVATNSLAPNISVQFGDVHENADANKIAGKIKEILQYEIAVASEGVY